MERLKVLCVVMVVLLGSSMASAYIYGVGGDWNATSTWYDSGTGMEAGVIPSAATTIYMQYTSPSSGPYSPVYINDGESGETGYAYVSLYDTYGGGGIDVNGSLNIPGGIFIGNWFVSSAPASDFVMNIGANGDAAVGGYGLFTTGLGQSNTQVFNVNGGSLDIAAISGAGTTFAFNVNGDGYLGIYGAVDSFTGTIDLADAARVVLQTSVYDSLLGNGMMLANGAVGSASDFNVEDAGNGLSQISLIPEPATMVLLGLGALVLRRKK